MRRLSIDNLSLKCDRTTRGRACILLINMLVKATLVTYMLSVPLAGSAAAQSIGGSVLGNVRDQAGSLLTEVRVTAVQVETGSRRTIQTNGSGRYEIPKLPIGAYEVEFALAGFKTETRRGITVPLDGTVVLDVVMEVGNVAERVVVTDVPPEIELTRGSLTGLVDEDQIRTLPLNGRSVLQLALQQPGVTSIISKTGGQNLLGVGLQMSVNGAGRRSNSFLLDGTNINNSQNTTTGGVSGLLLGAEAIKEFRVLTNSYDSEYGRAGGGVVSLATKSGTNDFHGTLFEFHRNDNLDARNFFDAGPAPEFKRNQFGFALGGPIKKDRTFFFTTGEWLRERRGTTEVTTVPSLAARNGGLGPINPAVVPYLNLFPLPNGPDLGGGLAVATYSFKNSVDENFFQARLDHRLSARDHVFGRYTFDDATVVVPTSFPLFRIVRPGRNQYLTLEATRVVSQTLLAGFRFSFNRQNNKQQNEATREINPSLFFVPSRNQFGRISIGGMPVFGTTQPLPNDNTQNIFGYSANVTHIRNKHSIRAGALVERYQVAQVTGSFSTGQYVFPNIVTFLRGQPSVLQVESPSAIDDRAHRYTYAGLYVQDDLKLRQNLTLNLGLRYELTSVVKDRFGRTSKLNSPDVLTATSTVPGPLYENPSRLNFAPRFGFAWDPFNDGRTAVRGGFGIYYDSLQVWLVSQAVIGNAPFNNSFVLVQPSFPSPAIPSQLQGALRATVIDPDLEQPYLLHYNLNVQRTIAPSLVLTVAYSGSRGFNLIRGGNVNAPVPQILPDGRRFYPGPVRGVLPRRNPNFSTIDLKRADGNSWYNALHVSLDKRFGHGLQAHARYSLSRTIDDTQGTNSTDSVSEVPQALDPDDRSTDRGLAEFHVKHVFTANVLYDLPFGRGNDGFADKVLGGWRLGGLAVVRSGIPFSVGIQANRSNTGHSGASEGIDRPDLRTGRTCDDIILGTSEFKRAGLYYDPTAFELQPAGFIGSFGRNVCTGPGLATFDVTLNKQLPLARLGDVGAIQFRVDVFNVFNHTNFGLPDRVVFAGVSPSESPLTSAGRIRSTATDSRQIQVGLKLVF
jgi:hypothetical protein